MPIILMIIIVMVVERCAKFLWWLNRELNRYGG